MQGGSALQAAPIGSGAAAEGTTNGHQGTPMDPVSQANGDLSTGPKGIKRKLNMDSAAHT